jgi:hypothetical protein
LIALSKSESFVGYTLESGDHEEAEMPYVALIGILSSGYSPHNLVARPIFDIAHQTFKFKDSSLKKDLNTYFKDIKSKTPKISTDTIHKHLCRDIGEEVLDIFGDPTKLAPNAESTIKKKGRDSPLEDTLELRNHLGYIIDQDPIKLIKTG